MRNRFISFISTFLLVLFTAFQCSAQYPVQVQPRIMSPASLNLSDYYTGTVPKLTVMVTNRDLQQPSLNVILRVIISNNSIQLKSDELKVYNPVTLSAGVPMELSGPLLAQYLNPENLIFQGLTKQAYLQKGQLPEGLYNFCFQVIEANTNKVLSQSNSCALAWISKTEPPLLNTPLNMAAVIAKNPTFIPFNWTPRHQNSANNAVNTTYEFELVELLDNKVDPNAGFASSRVLLKTKLESSTFLYGTSNPPLIVGKRYAWRVRAIPSDPTKEYDEFRNNGYSDIYSFSYEEDLPRFEIEEFNIENNQLQLNWNNVKDFIGLYYVQFEYNGALSQKVSTSANSYTIADVAKTLYPELQITSKGKKRIYAYVSYFSTSGEIKAESVYTLSIDQIDNSETTTKSDRKAGDTTNHAIPDKTPATNVLTSRSAIFQGRIQWAYFNDVNKKTGIRALTNTAMVNTVLTKNQSPSEKFSLEGATVKLYHEKNGVKSLIKTCKTDDNGNYKIAAIKEDDGKYSIEVEHSSRLFSASQAYTGLEENKINSDSKYIGNSNHTVFLNNAELDINIFAPQLSETEVDGFTAEVYLESNKFNNTYGKVDGMLNSVGSKLTHNRSNFIKIGELSKTGSFLRVLPNQNNITSYLVVLKSLIYPEKIVTVTAPNMFMRASQTLEYEVAPVVYGKVTANNKTLALSNIEIQFNLQDVLGEIVNGKVVGDQVIINQQTDFNGEYSIEIPLLKEKAVVQISITNRLASAEAHRGNFPIGKQIRNEYNYNFKNITYTYVGLLTKKDGVTPLPGLQITHPTTGNTIQSTKDGFFLLQLNEGQGDEIKITGDGFTPQVVSLSRLSKIGITIPANISEAEKASEEWSQAISKLSWVTAYLRANADLSINAGMFKSAEGNNELKTLYSKLRQNDLDVIGGIVPIGIIKIAPKVIEVTMLIEVEGIRKAGKIQIFKNDELFQEIIINKPEDKGLFKGPAGYYKVKILPLEGKENDFIPEEKMQLLSMMPTRPRYGMSAPELAITPEAVAETDPFLPMEMGMYLSAQYDNKPIIYRPESMFHTLNITVLDSTNNTLLDAKVIVDNLRELSCIKGKYRLMTSLSKSKSVLIKIKKDGYNAVNRMVEYDTTSSNTVVIIKLEKALDVKIETIGGFKVEVTNIKEDPKYKKDHWIVSGTMTLPANNLFKAKSGADFEDVSVTIGETLTAMVPTEDFDLMPSIVKGIAYDAFPVEIENLRMVKAPRKNDYIAAMLIASHVKVLLSGNTEADADVKTVLGKMGPGAFLMQKKDRMDNLMMKGEITGSEGTDNLTSIAAVFKSPESTVDSLTLKKVFRLKFEDGADITVNIMGEIKFKITTSKAIISQDGITLLGLLPIPNIFKSKTKEFPIKYIRINKTLNGIDVIFNVSVQNPFVMEIQKISSALTGLQLLGLGSPNCGFSLSGLVWLNESDAATNKDKRGNVLVIKNFEFKKIGDDDFSVAAQFSLDGGKPVKLKGLSFMTDQNNGIGFSLNTLKGTFEFNAGGTVKCDSTGSAAAKKVFGEEGIGVDFKLRTKDWAFLMKADANVKIKLGVVTISVNTFLVNVGYGVKMKELSDLLAKREASPKEMFAEPELIKTGGDEMVSESKSDWAIGVSGGLEFPIEGLDIGISGRFIIANISNSIQFKLDSIGLNIKTPAAEVKVSAYLSISKDVTEFGGSGTFMVMGTGLTTGFSYKETTTFFNVQANLLVKVGAPIITGPIGWLAIGGGFEIQLRKGTGGKISGLDKFKVTLMGSATAAGGSRQTMFLDSISLSVEYNGLRNCLPLLPPVIVTGGVSLHINNQRWARVEASLDFCVATFQLAINASIPEMIKGMPNIQANGVIFGAGPSVNKQFGPLLYIGINTSITTGILNGTANIAFGVNVNRNHPALTSEVKNSLAKLDQEVMQNFNGASYFHGAVVDGEIVIPGDQKKFDIKISILPSFGMSYNYAAKAKAKIFVNFEPETFKPKTFKLKATVTGTVNGTAYVSKFNLGAKVQVDAKLEGGYNDKRGWYASGNFGAELQAWSGNMANIACNSIEWSYKNVWTDVSQAFTPSKSGSDWGWFTLKPDKYCPDCIGLTTMCMPDICVSVTKVVSILKKVQDSEIGIKVCVGIKGDFEFDKVNKTASLKLAL